MNDINITFRRSELRKTRSAKRDDELSDKPFMVDVVLVITRIIKEAYRQKSDLMSALIRSSL